MGWDLSELVHTEPVCWSEKQHCSAMQYLPPKHFLKPSKKSPLRRRAQQIRQWARSALCHRLRLQRRTATVLVQIGTDAVHSSALVLCEEERERQKSDQALMSLEETNDEKDGHRGRATCDSACELWQDITRFVTHYVEQHETGPPQSLWASRASATPQYELVFHNRKVTPIFQPTLIYFMLPTNLLKPNTQSKQFMW